MTLDLGLVSGGRPIRYRSSLNHELYARRHGRTYHFDCNAYSGLQTPHFHKLAAVRRVLARHDWVLWMDDDSFFVPEKVKLEESDLELKHDDELNRDWYQYHGFIVLPNI